MDRHSPVRDREGGHGGPYTSVRADRVLRVDHVGEILMELRLATISAFCYLRACHFLSFFALCEP